MTEAISPSYLADLGLICGMCSDCRGPESYYDTPCGSLHTNCSLCVSHRAALDPEDKIFLDNFLATRLNEAMTSYTASQFPKGTHIRTEGSTGRVTSTTGDGASLVVHYTSDNSTGPRSVKPNRTDSKFRAILITPYEPKIGDRVRATINLEGFSGFMVGVVTDIHLPISIRNEADNLEYDLDEDMFLFTKLETPWVAKLAELPVRTIITHVSIAESFAIKGSDFKWRTGLGVIITPTEAQWILPKTDRVQDAR